MKKNKTTTTTKGKKKKIVDFVLISMNAATLKDFTYTFIFLDLYLVDDENAYQRIYSLAYANSGFSNDTIVSFSVVISCPD